VADWLMLLLEMGARRLHSVQKTASAKESGSNQTVSASS
jgi:hypothetical protein